MNFRETTAADIPQMQKVRNSVRENRLSDPSLVTDADVEDYITRRGRGWICEIRGLMVGFAIISIIDNNVWALFVLPGFEKLGIGKKLHDMMLDWYFLQTNKLLWLGTAAGTRAEGFYRKAGWKDVGFTKNGEIRFEMTAETWKSLMTR